MRCRSLGLGVLLTTVSLLPVVAKAGPSWPFAPLEGPGDKILAHARSRGAHTAPAEILLAERTYRIDDQGRMHRQLRLIFRVDEPEKVKEWGVVRVGWAPWHQERPRLQARVIGADGRAHRLDPKTIAYERRAVSQPDVFTDVRILSAPLPAFAAGSVVEEIIETQEHRPQFASGGGELFRLDSAYLPVRHARMIVERPAASPFHHQINGKEVRVSTSSVGDTRRFVAETSQTAVPGPRWPSTPPSYAPFRFVRFSVARDWQSVAREYGATVDQQIGSVADGDGAIGSVADGDGAAGGPAALAELLADLPRADSEGADVRRVASTLGRRILDLTRYTGVAFGEAAIVPRPPTETLERRFGDCKDLATLMVAALRTLGFDAAVALVRVGSAPAVSPLVPGMGDFNHAIVHVRTGPRSPGLWVDLTARHNAIGEVPPPLAGRWALVADPKVRALERLPRGQSSDSTYVEDRVYQLAPMGTATVEETFEVTGPLAAGMRATFTGRDVAGWEAFVRSYATPFYQQGPIELLEHSDPTATDRPFRHRVRLKGVRRAVTHDDHIDVVTTDTALFDFAPRALRAADERAAPLWWTPPYRAILNTVIHPPAGFRARELPESQERALGGGKWKRQFEALPDGTVRISSTFDSQDPIWTPAEVRQFRALYPKRDPSQSKNVAVVPIHLVFDHQGARLLSQGKTAQGLAVYRQAADADPADAIARVRWSRALLGRGYGLAARAVAEAVVEAAPGDGTALTWLGRVRSHDPIGRSFKPGWDVDGARSVLLTALRREPDNGGTRNSLGFAYLNGPDGGWTQGEALAQGIEHLRYLYREQGDAGLLRPLSHAMFRAGLDADLLRLTADVTHPAVRVPRVGSVAMRDGVEAAEREARRLVPDSSGRAGVLKEAVSLLVGRRAYERARALARIAEAHPEGALQRPARRLLEDLQRFESVVPKRRAPDRPVVDLMTAQARGPLSEAQRAELVSADLAGRWPDDGMDWRWLAVSNPFGQPGADAFLVDSLLARWRRETTGDASLGRWIVKLTSPDRGIEWVAYVARIKGRPRVVATLDTPGLVAREIESLHRAGTPELAAAWLDAYRDVAKSWSTPERIRGWAMIKAASDKALPLDVRLARAVAVGLSVGSPADCELALGHLDKLDPSPTTPTWPLALHIARARALSTLGRFADALEPVRRARQVAPKDDSVCQLELDLLNRLNRLEALTEAGDRCAAALSEDSNAQAGVLDSLATTIGSRGDLEESYRRFLAALDIEPDRFTTARLANNLAWNRLFAGQLDAALEHAERSVRLREYRANQHTLACIHAARGERAPAWQLLEEMVGRTRGLKSGDWYIVGRLAEHDGLPEVACSAYGRVPKPDEPGALSVWALTQQRIGICADR